MTHQWVAPTLSYCLSATVPRSAVRRCWLESARLFALILAQPRQRPAEQRLSEATLKISVRGCLRACPCRPGLVLALSV